MRAKKQKAGARRGANDEGITGKKSERRRRVAVSNWMDPNCVPEIIAASTGGKG